MEILKSEIGVKRYKGLVYSRKNQGQDKRGTIQQHHQEPIPRLDHEILDNPSKASKIDDPGIYESNSSSQLDLPIALRKGVRSCTKHPLSNFTSYNNLSASYSAFISQVSSVTIPSSI